MSPRVRSRSSSPSPLISRRRSQNSSTIENINAVGLTMEF